MRRGFTLIELLIVIGILAILSTGTVFLLNPAEKFRETRDGQRLSDFRIIREAIDLYLTGNSSAVTSLNDDAAAESQCRMGNTGFPAWRTSLINTTVSWIYQPFINPNPAGEAPAIANPRAINGSGWVSVNFSAISIGNPLSKLPLDPVNANPEGESSLATPNSVLPAAPGAYFYAYQCQGLTYEINANMESQKYSTNGPRDVESKDGGTRARYDICFDPQGGEPECTLGLPTPTFLADQIYEVGNDPGLDL